MLLSAARLRVLGWALLVPGLAGAQAPPSPAVVVFSQPGFPTLESEPVPQATLRRALGGEAVFAGVGALRAGGVLHGASLLVLPYGSAFPADAWPAIEGYLNGGGNLLLVGGEPLRVPVGGDHPGSFAAEAPGSRYSRALDYRHSYPVPLGEGPRHFAWREGYTFLPKVEVRVRQVFAQEGRLNGLGYLESPDGTKLAAPVIVSDHLRSEHGGRIVALPFTPEPGYWESPDGVALLGAAAGYARAGATAFSIEAQYSTVRPGERPELTAHLRGAGHPAGKVQVELLGPDGTSVDKATLALGGAEPDAPLPFRKPLPPGVYIVRATWTREGQAVPGEFAENGFVVEDLSALAAGPALAVRGDFLQLGGKPFLPVGTNYFTTEENGWDFGGPRNAAVWERDFADMERHGVNFVRTGVWTAPGKLIDPVTGGANERFLRNLEAYLAAAQRHHIAVNFTCFAFSPHMGEVRAGGQPGEQAPLLPNPYLDPAEVRAEQGYVRSVAERFGRVPFLSYDLINEPSFSNPGVIFHGNVPNGDAAELGAWQGWLRKHYGSLEALAETWEVRPGQLGSWDAIALPKGEDLSYSRSGNTAEVRAVDYNLFAQDAFGDWVRGMVGTIRATGSTQLVNVGQDEGGVTDRLLNQFCAAGQAGTGVAFTTNHTYWQDGALLWDSVAAKRPGMPNITGETGYQPAWNPDGSWRYDELTGTAVEERKWALGFAAGSSGALQWDWAREPDFGMERSDGSAKVWEAMMRELGRFATAAAPYATGLMLPEVAVVLPQSLGLSVLKSEALEAQQTAVRVLYYSNRVEAYAVGEYQTATLGTPKLIVLPSVYGLAEGAWTDIEARVRAGAVLLVSGPFSADAHLQGNNQPGDRASRLGLPYRLAPLQTRDEQLRTPFGEFPLAYGGSKTTTLDRAVLPDGGSWAERPLGKGTVLFSALPLELNDQLPSVAAVYAYALRRAGVQHTYTTEVIQPGILICPTRLPHATLYVLTSEAETMPVAFTDGRSGRRFAATLEAGRAALLLVGERGDVLASYGWHGR